MILIAARAVTTKLLSKLQMFECTWQSVIAFLCLRFMQSDSFFLVQTDTTMYGRCSVVHRWSRVANYHKMCSFDTIVQIFSPYPGVFVTIWKGFWHGDLFMHPLELVCDDKTPRFCQVCSAHKDCNASVAVQKIPDNKFQRALPCIGPVVWKSNSKRETDLAKSECMKSFWLIFLP